MLIKRTERKKYYSIHTIYAFLLTVVLVLSTMTGVMIARADAVVPNDGNGDNQPPIFGIPTPTNSSTNLSLSFIWSIPINDTEGDLFNWSIECSNGQSANATDALNGTKSLPLTELTYATTYIIWVNATDSFGSNQWTKAWFVFTTKHEGKITVSITSPKANSFYFNGNVLFSLKQKTFIYGPITIAANVIADEGITKVEFWFDGKLKNTTTKLPYNYTWKPILQFNGLSIKRNITVIAYDTLGNNASASINVSKWRFHPIIFAAGALVLASSLNIRLIPHTTITGFVFNMKERNGQLSFFALRVHYKTVGLLHSEKGVLRFQNVRIFSISGPKTMISLGPLHLFSWISCTGLGRIHFSTDRSTQGMFQRPFINNIGICG